MSENRLPRLVPLYVAPCDTVQYLQALLQAGLAAGRCTQRQVSFLMDGFPRLLQQECLALTVGESSSLAAEQAQEIAKSVLYALGFVLRRSPSPDVALGTLLAQGVEKTLAEGRSAIARSVSTAKRLWQATKSSALPSPNSPYRYTIFTGLGQFFQSYNIRFAAHDTPADIDYPLAIPVWRHTGVEFMTAYLQHALWENALLSRFSATEVNRVHLLYQPTYKTLPQNLMEPVLLCAIGCLLSGRLPRALRPHPDLLLPVQNRLARQDNPAGCQTLLAESARALAGVLNIKGGAQNYIIRVAQNNASTLFSAAQNGHIANFFFALPQGPPASPAAFTDGALMQKDDFFAFCAELSSCRHTADKLAMAGGLASLQDLLAVLQGECFAKEEYPLLFDQLDKTTLAVLARQAATKAEAGTGWQAAFAEWAANLPVPRKASLSALCRRFFPEDFSNLDTLSDLFK